MELYFATSNEHKFKEARAILNKEQLELIHLPFVYHEIRSDSFEEIAIDAVKVAYKKVKKPIFVEDGGLTIDALNGFPGTYSAGVFKKIGNKGVVKLMDGITNRTATFRACIAYTDGTITRTFSGECKGTISSKEKGESGFGYDPVFIPDGHTSTFGEKPEIKEKLSHRYKALMEFVNYLKQL